MFCDQPDIRSQLPPLSYAAASVRPMHVQGLSDSTTTLDVWSINLFTLCRLTNGASLSKQDQAELQRVKSSLLQLPSRKRSRSSMGVDRDRGAERDSSPSTSTAARSQDRAYRRTTSAQEGGATSKPDKPARYAFYAPCFSASPDTQQQAMARKGASCRQHRLACAGSGQNATAFVRNVQHRASWCS